MHKPDLIAYDMATNFDPELIEIIHRHNQNRIFQTMFGKLRQDFFGGDRSSITLPDITLKDLGSYIEKCHARNIKFNYLMNPVCTSNRLVFPDDHKEMLQFIDKIVELGIDGVTLTSPLLCSIFQRRHPNIEITVGLYAWVFTIKQIMEWKNLGAHVVTLGSNVTRDFPLLEAMMKLAKKISVKLRLIANNGCLKDCTYKNSHSGELAHSSQPQEKGSEFFVDYNMLQCNYIKMTSPDRFISSDWIRPEDVGLYEALCEKNDFRDLSIKLLDNWKSTQFLSRVIESYANGSFEGNLIDLLSFPREGAVKYTFEENVRLATKYEFNPMAMMRMGEYFNFPNVFIDNKKLNGFLEPFSKGMTCNDKICYGSPVVKEHCDQVCRYCKDWAEKAITLDEKQVTQWRSNAEALLESMKTSEIFLPFVK